MKAVSVLLTLIILENWIFQLPLLAANHLMDNRQEAYLERRQLRLGNYNYNNNWRLKDCKSFSKDYQHGFARQHDIALFNATPSAHDLTQKYQVMYFPKETSMPGRSTLVSSPFLFYKMLLPRPQHHRNGLENLANTGAHLFPTEESMVDNMMPTPTMMPTTSMMPTPAMMPDMPASMAPPAMTDAGNTAPPAMTNTNVQTRNNAWNSNSYQRNIPSSYQQRSRMANSQQSYDFFNQNFAQLEYLQNNPKNIDIRMLVEQTPLYRTLPRHRGYSFVKNIKRSNQVDDKRYLPIKPLHMPRSANIKMNILEPPFQASPFIGYMSDQKFIPLKTYTQDDVNFLRSQQNSNIL